MKVLLTFLRSEMVKRIKKGNLMKIIQGGRVLHLLLEDSGETALCLRRRSFGKLKLNKQTAKKPCRTEVKVSLLKQSILKFLMTGCLFIR